MIDRIDAFWAALGALTFAETVTVSEVMRDAWEADDHFEATSIHNWSFLLNTAREIAEDRSSDEVSA